MTDIVSRVVTTFPALVEGDGGVTIDKSAGVYTIGFDFNAFWSVTGDMLVRNVDGNPQSVSTGAAGTVLTSTGIGALPEYVAIGVPQIPDGSIDTLQLADEAVTTPKLAPEAVDATKMGALSVSTSALIDLSVTEGKLGALSVSTAKIQADAVTATELVANAVIEAKIAANAVTATKIVDKAVSLTKMADGVTQGEVYYIGAGLVPELLAPGTPGQVLSTAGAGADPAWVAPDSGTSFVIDRKYSESRTYGTLGLIPYDDTTPQISEGSQILTPIVHSVATIGNKLSISGSVAVGSDIGNNAAAVCLFVDSGVNAVSVSGSTISDPAKIEEVGYVFEYIPADTGPHTYTIRAGTNALTGYVNGNNGGRRYGGALVSSQELVEYLP